MSTLLSWNIESWAVYLASIWDDFVAASCQDQGEGTIC